LGTSFPNGIFLRSANQYQEVDLILPDRSRVPYVGVSPAGWTDAVFETTSDPDPFYKSKAPATTITGGAYP
jgi:hypothetical protein